MSVSPLTLYLLWHPEAREAAALAAEAYRWFHLWSDDLLRSGMGVPVYFRSQPAAEGSDLPREIDVDGAELNVVVVLADAHMVRQPVWAAWLDRLAGQEAGVLMLPVALHESAYRLPETLRRLNFIRIDARNDPPADTAATHARRTPRLLRQLTEVIGRELGARLACSDDGWRPGQTPRPLSLFLSHAKRDGVAVAEALRSSIQDHNRVRAFFDDSDLPVGHAFATELEREASSDSAAMIAIVSDGYAVRPWCRREVSLARKPRAEPGAPKCWAIRPLLVVDNLSHRVTRTIPELGNATVVRWQPERALETVDVLMLEILLSSYHRLRARRVPPVGGRHVISWTPDAISLLELQRAASEPVEEVLYPGYALPEAERQTLAQLLPDLRLRTLEDAASSAPVLPRAAVDRVVGLSTGFNDDLGRLGLGTEHLEEITLRVAHCVVEAGGRVAFGGMLRSSGLAETLLTLARSLSVDDDSPDAKDPAPPILSYQRWPALPSVEQIASDVGICEYVLVDTPLPVEERIGDDRRMQSPERARQHGHALSAMRRAMSCGGYRTSAARSAPKLDARVVVGGARVDFNGFLPGVVEESLYALEARQAVFVLGGFGGGAAVFARALLQDALPPELTAAFHRRRSERFRLLEQGLSAHGEATQVDEMFGRLAGVVASVRRDLAGGLNNGLDAQENRRLMESDHVSEIVDLLRLAMARLWASA